MPETLLSGNHAEIERWRMRSSLVRTFLKRSDLLTQRKLNAEELAILESWKTELDEILDYQKAVSET